MRTYLPSLVTEQKLSLCLTHHAEHSTSAEWKNKSKTLSGKTKEEELAKAQGSWRRNCQENALLRRKEKMCLYFSTQTIISGRTNRNWCHSLSQGQCPGCWESRGRWRLLSILFAPFELHNYITHLPHLWILRKWVEKQRKVGFCWFS